MRHLMIFVNVCLFSCVKSIMFQLLPNSQKCLREEVKKDVLVIGEFEVDDVPGQHVGYVVTDSKHEILAQNNEISKGKFSFSTEHEDIFEVCFNSKVPPHQRGTAQDVKLILKRGLEAKPYEALAEAGKLKPMELELKKLEDLSSSIVEDFAQMREREVFMRGTNESTNNRVLYFSILSMICLLSLSVWQVLYLRKYFRSRKLIE